MSSHVADKGAAFRQLADQHLDANYGLARAILRDPTEAQDAVHDALLAAWRRWDTLRDPASFPFWFRRIVVNTCRDRIRHNVRHPTTTLSDVAGIPASDSTGAVHDHTVLDRAFADLSADDQVILILRYFLDLPTDDIASLVDVRPGTVGSRLNRAQACLGAVLTESDRAEAVSRQHVTDIPADEATTRRRWLWFLPDRTPAPEAFDQGLAEPRDSSRTTLGIAAAIALFGAPLLAGPLNRAGGLPDMPEGAPDDIPVIHGKP